MTAAVRSGRPVVERAGWRAVAMPSEHGGWGLTLEPVLLGLLVAPSIGGVAVGVAAFMAFLVRTPLELVAVDIRRDRWLARSGLAARIAAVEVLAMAVAVVVVVVTSGWTWVWPVVVAAPLVAVELGYGARSRSRRLVPELCGAIAIAGSVAAIVLASGRGGWLAAGLWSLLAARAVGAIPFVRVQIVRLRRGSGPTWPSDVAQLASLGCACVAVAADGSLLVGALGVVAAGVTQSVWVRRPPIAPKRLGMRLLVIGLALVALAATGVAM